MISLHIHHLCSPFVHACVVSKETTRNKGLIDGIVANVLSTRLLQVSVVPGVLLKIKLSLSNYYYYIIIIIIIIY